MISIIVPVFNAEKTVGRCLDSLLNQGVGEEALEIVCVDDGSEDGSAEVLRRYAELHPCIKIYSQENAGAGPARNLGLDYSHGEIVTFCDADDYLIPDGLGYLLRTFWTDEVEVLCHGSITLDARKLRNWKETNDTHGRVVMRGTGREVYERDTKYFVWNTLIRRSVIDRLQLRFKPIVMCEDACFLLELLMADPNTVDVDACIYRYTESAGQLTRQRDPQMMRRYLDAYILYIMCLRHYGQERALRLQLRPLYSRMLSAKLNAAELRELNGKLSSLELPCIPYLLYVPASWFHRHVLIPYLLPMMGRG